MSPVSQPAVLIVEDEYTIRTVAAAAFADDGFTVLEAEHAAEALSIHASADAIHVLFTDIHMPGELNGIDLAERLRSVSPGLHIIITSAVPLLRSVDHIGAFFVAKPYRAAAVCRSAKEMLAR